MDYDQNGSIGSVDILNLKTSLLGETLEVKGFEQILEVFQKQSVEKQFGVKFKRYARDVQETIEVKTKKTAERSAKISSKNVIEKVSTKNDAAPLASILHKKPDPSPQNESVASQEKEKKVTVVEAENDFERNSERSSN